MQTATIEQIVGRNVRLLRESRGWSQAELGQHLGAVLGNPLPSQTVSLMERGGRSFVAAEVVGLAVVLNATLAWLFRPPIDVDTVSVGELSLPRAEVAALVAQFAYPTGDTEAGEVASLLTASAISAQEIGRLLGRVEEAHRRATSYFEDEARRAAEDEAADIDESRMTD